MMNDAHAAVLYGTPTQAVQRAPAPAPASAPAPAPAPLPEAEHPLAAAERLSDALYAPPEGAKPAIEVPDEVRELRSQDPMRKLYGGQSYAADIPDNLGDENPEVASLPPEVRSAVVAEVREMAADLGLTSNDLREMKSLEAQFKTEPDAETREGWVAESMDLLQREYGKDWQTALSDAKRFIARDPRVAHILSQSGRGDHPKVVSMFTRLARQARNEGKLK